MVLHGPANSLDIKRANRNRIYRFIHAHPGTSRPELVQRLGISLPTVMQNVKSLFLQGLVKEDGSLESTGGRKAVALSPVPDARLAVGVEITRSHVEAVVINMEGTVLASRRQRLAFCSDPGYAFRLGGIVRDLVISRKVDRTTILGAGVSLPGFLSADGSVFRTTVLPDALHYETGGLGEAIGYPAVYLNDANAAAIAEMWDTPENQCFVYLSLSNSVGGAIIAGGGPTPGDNQRGGEFGHITVEYGGRPCYCGKRGCLDAYCAAGLLSDMCGGNLAEFFRRLRKGGTRFKQAWSEYLGHLARAVNVLRMVFDCEVVVGGYVGAHMEPHIGELRRLAAPLNSHDISGDYIRVCRRRSEASAVGAALVHIEKFIREI